MLLAGPHFRVLVKKIRLKASQSDSRIFREVNALSRLNHRFIVRYYTTWIETSELPSTTTSSVGSDSGTSVPTTREHSIDGSDETDPFSFDMDDLTSESHSRRSFPSIRFTRSETAENSSESDEIDDDDPFLPEELRGKTLVKRASPSPGAQPTSRTLYIQMVCLLRPSG